MRSRKIIKFGFYPNHTVNINPLAFLRFAWANVEGPVCEKKSSHAHSF